jgi:hypothetical protein
MPLHAAHVIEDDLLLKADLSGHLVRLPCGVFSPRVDPRPCGGLACIFAVLVVPVVLAIVGYQFMKRMAFNLVDEEFDLGDALLVRSGGQEERIALADIKNVNFFPYMSPPKSLRQPSAFGDTVVFCAPMRMMPLSPIPTIVKLIDRIDAARRER